MAPTLKPIINKFVNASIIQLLLTTLYKKQKLRRLYMCKGSFYTFIKLFVA